MQTNQTIAFRLKPGQDLLQGIDSVVKSRNIEAGWMLTAVGSLTHYTIRFANQPEGSSGNGHFEIVSLTGILSTTGNHLHISISDSTGQTIGGHLLPGNTIYTAAELVIGYSDQLQFSREQDGTTPWKELQVREKRP